MDKFSHHFWNCKWWGRKNTGSSSKTVQLLIQQISQWPPCITFLGTEKLIVLCELLNYPSWHHVTIYQCGCFKDSIYKNNTDAEDDRKQLLGMQYLQFLNMSWFCSLGINHVRELKWVISNACSVMRFKLYNRLITKILWAGLVFGGMTVLSTWN